MYNKRSGKPTRPNKGEKPSSKQNRKASSKKRPDRSEEKPASLAATDGTFRLNKFISNAGVCSRREADTLIADGKIKVNGKVVTEMGRKVTLSDKVAYNGKLLNPETYRYILLNKPKGYISTTDDPMERKTVMDLIAKACVERVYPVGRLDRETLGLLLFTNDGELAKKLTNPNQKVKKIYHVFLDKKVEQEDMDQMVAGVKLEDGITKAEVVNYVAEQPEGNEVGIQIHYGHNQIVHKLFEHFGYKVVKLDRVLFAGLTKKDLPRGRWRHLTEKQVGALKMLK